jgi:two-component system OmpR family response regulator
MATVLIVEDDPTIREITKLYFEKVHDVILAEDGMEAARAIKEKEIDLVILDLILPKISGETVAQIASCKKIPVIMVTAKNTEEDILDGLRLGAVDYITKPFSPKVLLAKANNFLERLHFSQEKKYPYVDLQNNTLVTEKGTVYLSATEAKVLNELLKNRESVLSREELLKRVWNAQKVSVRIVDATVKNLRKKLKKSPVKIKTIFGRGYCAEMDSQG